MFRIRKKASIAKAYRLGDEGEEVRRYIEKGTIKRLSDGNYRVITRESDSGEICAPGDYLRIDINGDIYPNRGDFFLESHTEVGENLYEEVTRPMWAWRSGEPESEEILFLKSHKGLVIDEQNTKAYFSAPLWRTTETADRDATLVFYNIERDNNNQIQDIDFNFVASDVFRKTYTIITAPENDTEKDIMITTLSLIAKDHFQNEEYQTDEGPFYGFFTNEAPAKYLIQKLYRQRYTFFNKIIVLATSECLENKFTVPNTSLQDMTTTEYFENMVISYMHDVDKTAFSNEFPSSRPSGLFEYIRVDNKSVVSGDMAKLIEDKVDDPWSANIYMDFTGGYRSESLAGMMVMRCLEASGYNVRSVVYSYHSTRKDGANDPHQVIDITNIYNLYDAVIAKTLLTNSFTDTREEQLLTLHDRGFTYDSESYSGNEENRKDYAVSWNGSGPYIFLSYAHKDMLLAQSLLKNLHKRGIFNIWYDEGITPGEIWDEILSSKIENCAYFIALITPNYNEREFCKREFSLELEVNGCDKILALYYGTENIAFLDSKEEEIVTARQGIVRNKYKESDFYDKIVSYNGIAEFVQASPVRTDNVFINLSNHPSCDWGKDQREEAEKYGSIVDIPFPNIPSGISSFELDRMIDGYVKQILAYGCPTVMVQGEYIFSFRIANILKEKGCVALAARTDRQVKEVVSGDGVSEITRIFEFKGFMEY